MAFARSKRWRPSRGRARRPSRPPVRAPAAGPAAAPVGAQPALDFTPFNGAYENRMGSINRDTANSEAEVTAQEANVKQDYGFDDASNPFNRAAMLQRSYTESRTRATNSYASQGQLYSGALQNAQDQNRFGYDKGHDSLRRDYNSQLAALKSRRAQIQAEAEQRRVDAEYERVNAAVANRPTADEAPEAAAPAAARRTIPAYYYNLSPAAKRRWWAKGR